MFDFIQDLCESKLIPSRSSLKHWDTKKLSELAYLYLLGLRVLLCDESERKWARDYCQKAGENQDFSEWRAGGNDLYAMLYALTTDAEDRLNITPSVIRNWLRHVAEHEAKDDTHPLFARLDSMFGVKDAKMRALRRVVSEWNKTDNHERRATIGKLVQLIHDRAPSNSELVGHLRKLDESASAGATGAASVATVVGGLGAGFDPDGDWRSIYSNKATKPLLIRRGKAASSKK